MSSRQSIERIAPAMMALTALLIAAATSGVAAWLLVRDARHPSIVAAPRENPYVQSFTLASAGGDVVERFNRDQPAPRGFAAAVAARLAPPVIDCQAAPLPDGTAGTLCIESSFAPLVPRVRQGLALIGFASLAATILGALAGMLLARRLAAPLRHMADVVSRASREAAYSLRVDAAGGEQGRLATSVNELLGQMQERDLAIRRRTVELEAVNKDLEQFAFTVSHDLRAPLGSIDGFTQALEADYKHLFDDAGREYIQWVREGCRQMRDLIDGMLQIARLAKAEVEREPVDLSGIAQSIAESLQQTHPDRTVAFRIRDGLRAVGDERLLRSVLENLMGNAFKFTRKTRDATIEFGSRDGAYFVRDNGAGFPPEHAAKMFRPFQRLHSSRDFEGTGIGLATVQKIIERHGGRTWAEGEVDRGATVYFTVTS